MLRAVKEYGYESGVIADWECSLCREIVLHEMNIRNLERAGYREQENCPRCERIVKKCDVLVESWWVRWITAGQIQVEVYSSSVTKARGLYGLRDDLRDRLLGQETAKQREDLQRVANVIGEALPAVERGTESGWWR